MIRLSVTLLACSILFACNSTNINPKPNAPVASNAINVKTPDTVVPFAGFWLNETYLKKIEHTRSPRESQGASNNCCLFIPASTLQPASMATDVHEGGPEMDIVKKDNSYQFYYKADDTASRQAYNIQFIAANKLKFGQYTFIKTDEHFMADILFSGKYRDTLGNIVQFSKDGHIKGLGTYTVYDPLYDYVGSGVDADQVYMGQSDNDMEQFGFTFRQDTLFIHNVNCLVRDSSDNTCLEGTLGDIKYKLIRIH
ncbi:hypothetical protein A4H97_21410 [Niastella yeongjuensis]|uniref:Lipoprotein n=2 Tax=Niastella yeongjuensis TaxID=354355 RepID=A0A1V9F7Z3_9BACT|nr:hypothetical protein A4H97_21410 [Niastella yeongjuensis]